MFDTSMEDLSLPDLLARMRPSSVPARTSGVVYTGFPPENLHESRTASWFYCPFFLQAANAGIPVIDLHVPPEFTQKYDELMQRAIDSRLLPTLSQLFQTFDAPMYIHTQLQNLHGRQ